MVGRKIKIQTCVTVFSSTSTSILNSFDRRLCSKERKPSWKEIVAKRFVTKKFVTKKICDKKDLWRKDLSQDVIFAVCISFRCSCFVKWWFVLQMFANKKNFIWKTFGVNFFEEKWCWFYFALIWIVAKISQRPVRVWLRFWKAKYN